MSILLTHPDLPGVEHQAVNEDQARTLAKSGWKRKSTTKAPAAKTEEK